MSTTPPTDLEVPLCARCNKLVDRVVSYCDQNTQEHVFRFHCHGAVEEVRLFSEEIVDAEQIEMGACFTGRALLIETTKTVRSLCP